MAGTYPAHTVEFAPGVAADVVPGAGDWVSITDKTFEWFTKWGTEDEFTQPGAGTGDLLLNNSSGDFDPDNASGPYFGDLLPGMWVRIITGTTAPAQDEFYGHVSDDGFQVAASQYSDSVVKVRLVDDAERLAHVDEPESLLDVYVPEDNPGVWWKLGESSGTQATDSSGNRNHGTYTGGATSGSVDAVAFNSDSKAIRFDGEDDSVYLASWTPGNTFTIEFWVEADAQSGEPAVLYLLGGGGPYIGEIAVYQTVGAAGTLDYAYTDPATGNRTRYVSTGAVFDGTRHHVAIVQNGATTSLYVDLLEGKTLASGAATSITWGPMEVAVGTDDFSPLTRHVGGVGAFFAGTIDELILFPTALAGLRIAYHQASGNVPWSGLSSNRAAALLDFVGYDATNRNISTGHVTMARGNLGQDAWSALVEVAKAEGGAVYIDHQHGGQFRFVDRRYRYESVLGATSIVTFGDGGGSEVPCASIDLTDDRIINIAHVQREGGAVVDIDESAGSVYGPRSISETGLLYDNDAESQARAERWVAEKKDRHRRVRSFTLEPRKSTHPAWAAAIFLQMGTRVTVKWRPTYGGTRSYDGWVIGIAKRWNHKAGLSAQFWLAPVPFDGATTPYWIAGVSLAGVDTRPGY